MWPQNLFYSKLSGLLDAASPRTALERYWFHLFKDEGLRPAQFLPWRWAGPLTFCAYLTKLLVTVNEMRLANASSSFLPQELVLAAPLAIKNKTKQKNSILIVTWLSASLHSDLCSDSLYSPFPDPPVQNRSHHTLSSYITLILFPAFTLTWIILVHCLWTYLHEDGTCCVHHCDSSQNWGWTMMDSL